VYRTARQHCPRVRAQRGAGKLKAIFWTVLLVFIAFAAFKITPVYLAEYQLADKMQEQARFGIVNRYSEEKIREIILKEIQSLDIPATTDNIKVVSTPDRVTISVDYTVPVDLFVYRLHSLHPHQRKQIASVSRRPV
jgi:hypothetical protein